MTARWWSRLTAFITLAAAWRLLAPTVADPDLWGHILFGQRTLSMGIERQDPFSYLSGGHGWINHEMLSEVAFGALYNVGGAQALIVLKLLIALFTIGLIYRHLVERGSDPLRSGLLLLPAVFLMVPGFATVRPQMFTFLFFALTMLALHRVETVSERWLWAFPPLFAIWINFHGGVLAGAGVLGVWGAARVVLAIRDPDRRTALLRLRGPVLAGLACGAALLANPYGFALPEFLFRTATIPRPDIVEWQSLDVISVPGLIYLALTTFAAVTIVRSPAPRHPALLAALVTIVVLPLGAIRHLQLFAIALPILLADDFAASWKRTKAPTVSSARERFAVLSVTGVIGMVLVVTGARDATCIKIDPARSIGFPVRAVAWLEDNQVEGNMATYFDWGEYVIWHLSPDIRVSMDGRRETVYPPSIYNEYLRFQSGLVDWRGVIDRPETDLVLFSKLWPTFQLLDLDPGWERVYEDAIGGVFVRAGHPLLERLTAEPRADLPADGAGICVP